MTHKQLCERAARWLKTIGCRVVLSEIASSGREIPDAIGWRSGISILIECKTSQADFKQDFKKPWRKFEDYGMGHHRLYLCEKGIIKPCQAMALGWGLLWIDGRKIQKVIAPKGNCDWGKSPLFKANYRNEVLLLVSALARNK